MKAVIDRIENEIAVILFGEDEVILDVPIHQLPDGVTEGTWLRVEFHVDDHTTIDRRRKNKFLLDKLIRKGKTDHHDL